MRKYDSEVHRSLRRRVGVVVASGGAVCARCGEPLLPGEPWDLGHAADGVGYAGPEHRACNRATSSHRVSVRSRRW